MKKTTLSLGDIYKLEAELSGSVNQNNGEVLYKGLLSQKVSLFHKYWLSELVDTVKEVKNHIDKLRNELIMKYGEKNADNPDQVNISVAIDKLDEEGNPVKDAEGNNLKIVNPKFREFEEEMSTLLKETKEIEHYEFKIEDFTKVETDESYVVFFKLLKTA